MIQLDNYRIVLESTDYDFASIELYQQKYIMSQNRLKPKYILLSTPTLKLSRSIHDQNPNTKSFEAAVVPKQQSLHQLPKKKIGSIRDSSCAKDISTVKQELTQTMQAFAIEQKKNSTLKALNELLQRANRQAENRQKLQIKPQIQKEKKFLQKQQYEIDQIQQKYNEEVARITALREQVNSARTDRVVYSALFKKIEMEIKHYENIYREQVVKTELTAHTKEIKPQSEDTIKQESVDQFQIKEDIENRQSRLEIPYDALHNFFMTNADHKHPKPHGKKTTDRISEKTTLLYNQIGEVQAKIEKIVKNAECFSVQQAISYYLNLNRQNNSLTNMIQETQWQIEEIEEQMERIRLEKRNSEVSEEKHMKKLTNLTIPSIRKLRSCKNLKVHEIEETEETPEKIFEKIIEIIGISKLDQSTDSTIKQIEEVLFGEQGSKRECAGGNPQHCLEGILQKMETFDNCERYYSKKQFQGQYIRELSRQHRQLKVRK